MERGFKYILGLMTQMSGIITPDVKLQRFILTISIQILDESLMRIHTHSEP